MRLISSLLSAAWLGGCAVPVSLARDPAADAAPLDDVRASDLATDATAPDATAPDATAPDATAPDVAAPDVAAPDATAPDVAAPDVTAPDATAPDVADAGPSPCPTGQGLIEGVCVVLLPPRLVAPPPTSTVTSHRPTLRWAPAVGTPGARVELCRDRACTRPVETIDVAASDSVRPTGDLTPGVYFWRLRGAGGGGVGASPGFTWSFYVGPRSAPVDTSYGSAADFNGDGYPDLTLLPYTPFYRDSNRSDVWNGGPMGLPAAMTAQVVAEARHDYAGTVAADLNDDGFTDLTFATTAAPPQDGSFQYRGVPLGLAGVTPTALPALPGPAGAPIALSNCVAGDFNRDGRNDLACAPFVPGRPRTVWAFFANESGGYATPATTLALQAPSERQMQSFFLHTTDLNGDGYLDVVAEAPTAGAGEVVSFLLGGSAGLSPARALPVVVSGSGACGPAASRQASPAVVTGDFNGDGFGDVALSFAADTIDSGTVEGNCIALFAGGADGLNAARSAQIEINVDSPALAFLSAGDVNGDGYTDLLQMVPTSGSPYRLGLKVLPGSAAGVVNDRRALILSSVPSEDFYAPYGAGDFNLDGYYDIVMNVRRPSDGSSSVDAFLLYAGSPTGLPPTPTLRLVYP